MLGEARPRAPISADPQKACIFALSSRGTDFLPSPRVQCNAPNEHCATGNLPASASPFCWSTGPHGGVGFQPQEGISASGLRNLNTAWGSEPCRKPNASSAMKMGRPRMWRPGYLLSGMAAWVRGLRPRLWPFNRPVSNEKGNTVSSQSIPTNGRSSTPQGRPRPRRHRNHPATENSVMVASAMTTPFRLIDAKTPAVGGTHCPPARSGIVSPPRIRLEKTSTCQRGRQHGGPS